MTNQIAAAEALAAQEKLIREHTLTLHLVGEQLSQIESWFWAHLADVREAARQQIGGPLPDDVTGAELDGASSEETDTTHTEPDRVAVHARVLRMEALVCAHCGHAWPCPTSRALDDTNAEQQAEEWRRKAVRRALTISKLGGTIRAVNDLAAEEVTARTEWGDGYRDAIADLQEVLREFGHLDRQSAPATTEATESLTVTAPEWVRQQIYAAVESEVYEYRERTMFWPEGGVTKEIARLATRGAMEVRDWHVEQLRQRLELADELARENTELHRYHAEDRDALTEMRATITRLRGEREQQRQRADRLAHDLTSWINLAKKHQQATIAALERADRLAATLTEVLAVFDRVTVSGNTAFYQATEHPIAPDDYDRWNAALHHSTQDSAGKAPTAAQP